MTDGVLVAGSTGHPNGRRPCDRKAVDVTTHLRGRAYQAGAFLAVIGVVLAVAPTPAQAAAPSVGNVQVSNANLQAKQQTAVTFTVTNNNASVKRIR